MRKYIPFLTVSVFIMILLSALVIPSVGCAEPPLDKTKVVSQVEPLTKITVEAGKYTRIDTVVSVELEGISSADALHLVEILPSGTKPVAAQIEPGEPPRLWWILSGTTPAESKRYYELSKKCDVKAVEVKAIKNDSFLELRINDANVLRYNNAVVPAPNDLGRKVKEEQRRLYDRSGFIHPLWSPSGDVMTDIHPADHIHHYGIWMPWTKTEFEGQEVDFWNVGRGLGTVRFVKFLSTTSGPVYGGFEAEQEHVALKTAEGEKVVLKEVWDVRAYNIGWPEKDYYLIDFKSTQRCVADSPLRQVQYRYGGFGFRGARQWKDENAAYLTSEGKTRVDGHGTRARWCDTAGAIEGKWAGVTIMSHPKNFQHPEPMRIWPPKDRFVFFNFAPSQLGDWEMKPGEDYVFRYRLYVHEGKINVADAKCIWNDYAEPPIVKLEKIKK